MSDKASPIFAYLHHVQTTLDVSASQIAKRAGISPSTITRFMSSKTYKYVPSLTTIAKIANATGIDPAPFLSTSDFAARSLEVRSDPVDGKFFPMSASTLVLGEANATFARAAAFVEELDWTPIPILYTIAPPQDCFAVIVRGGNINKYVQDGEILYCIRASVATFALQDDSIVIIERSVADDKRFIELSARILKIDGEIFTLHHASSDPKFTEVLRTQHPLDGDDFKIIGLATFIIRDVPQYQFIDD